MIYCWADNSAQRNRAGTVSGTADTKNCEALPVKRRFGEVLPVKRRFEEVLQPVKCRFSKVEVLPAERRFSKVEVLPAERRFELPTPKKRARVDPLLIQNSPACGEPAPPLEVCLAPDSAVTLVS